MNEVAVSDVLESTESVPTGTETTVETTFDGSVTVANFSDAVDQLAVILAFLLFGIGCIAGALWGKSVNWFKW